MAFSASVAAYIFSQYSSLSYHVVAHYAAGEEHIVTDAAAQPTRAARLTQPWRGARLTLAFEALVIGLTCAPRLGLGFGLDGDAARSALAAENWLQTGVYRPSRLPGNPLFEYMLGGILPLGGAYASNTVVMAWFALCVLAFAKLARPRANALLWTSLLGCTPILLVNAATTMDYVPGLALMLLAYAFARGGSAGAAGVAMGLAIGFRLSNVLFVIPLGLHFFLRHRPTTKAALKDVILFTSVISVISVSLYAPMFSWRMFQIPGSSLSASDYLLRTIYQALNLFGLVGTAGLIAVCLPQFRTLRIRLTKERLASLVRNPEGRYEHLEFLVEFLTVALFLALFVRHSDEPEYLIPVIPFLYLLLSRTLSRKQVLVLYPLIVSCAIINIDLKGGTSGNRHLTFQPTWGTIPRDYFLRKEIEMLRAGLARIEEDDPAVVITGMGPILTYHNPLVVPASVTDISPHLDEHGVLETANVHRLRERRVFLVYGLSAENCLLLEREGYRLFIFSEFAPSTQTHAFGFDTSKARITSLDILNDSAFYRPF